MRVGRIGHAGVVVMSGKTRCFMDPVLFSPFEAGANRFDPPFRVDHAAARDLCNLIVLSHHHGDHFCPRSLNVLRRNCPVVYPRDAHLIERTLERLGFVLRVPLDPGGRLEIEGLALTATGSRASFPELGIFFQAEGRTFWNPVDSVIDDSIIGSVRARAPRPDLFFANYQPLIEAELQEDALGTPFPFATYSEYLRQAWMVRARCVVPASFGARYSDDWLNQRGIPMTAGQFLEDLGRIDPEFQGLEMQPGDALEVGERIRLESGGLGFVTLEKAEAGLDWRPDRGVPPLADRNPLGLDELPARVARLLDSSFLERLVQADPVWLEKLARLEVRWRLEVVYPGDAVEVRLLDFSREPLAWSAPREGVFAKLHTSVTASALIALEAGRINRYAMDFNHFRMVNRLYEVHRGGVSWAGGRSDEPLTRVLFAGAEERYVDRQVDEILASPSEG